MRCACGYGPEYHGDGLCPLCSCGKLPSEHGPVWTPPSPYFIPDGVEPVVEPLCCPGRDLTDTGRRPQLKRAAYRAPAPDPPRRPWFGMSVPLIGGKPATLAGPPQARVRPRACESLDEIAKQANPIGKAAAALGWDVEPFYAVDAEGVELSYLLMRRGELWADAVWRRPPGSRTWATAGARAGRVGDGLHHVGVKRLRDLIDTSENIR